MFMYSKRIFLIVLVSALCFSVGIIVKYGYAASVGQAVSSIEVKDSNNDPKWIPDIGKKVVTIFYVDPDAKDVSDPLADAIKAKKFKKAVYRGVGITNLKDTWMPNALIRVMIRKKEKKYNTKILTDSDRTLSKKWGLGSCDDLCLFLIIGKDKKIKYIKKMKSQSESRSAIPETIKIIEEEVGK